VVELERATGRQLQKHIIGTTQDTADLTEGTNLYYTQARVWDDTWASTTLDTILTNSQTAYGWGDWSGEGFITDLSGFTTANLSENTNLYYTNTRVADYINGSSTMPVWRLEHSLWLGRPQWSRVLRLY